MLHTVEQKWTFSPNLHSLHVMWHSKQWEVQLEQEHYDWCNQQMLPAIREEGNRVVLPEEKSRREKHKRLKAESFLQLSA